MTTASEWVKTHSRRPWELAVASSFSRCARVILDGNAMSRRSNGVGEGVGWLRYSISGRAVGVRGNSECRGSWTGQGRGRCGRWGPPLGLAQTARVVG